MKRRFYSNVLFLFLLSFVVSSCKEILNKTYQESDIKIIPKVAELKVNPGVFVFNKNTSFVTLNENEETAALLLMDKFKKAAGWDLQLVKEAPNSNFIHFINDESLDGEAYKLQIFENHVKIIASNNSGFLYGVQSLRQLLPIEIESNTEIKNITWEVPNVEINDSPRFKWRGLMLDLSRHYFDKEYIKETIDILSLHKMNILHLHLVDDQGWRIEIKKYPKLTEVGAWRVDQEHIPWNSRSINDPNKKGTYGGFLTQQELKEIVAYATLKGIEVVPEIEMPAHVSSAIASYPELSCLEKPIAVPSGALWPITDIYCAGKENTFQFLEDVLLEVMEIFPSKYIHIGGDEATKTNWEACSHCKKRIEREGLKNVEELQSYFVKRMEKFINSKGKKLIGWDEILEGGLAPDATVMSWRGVKGGVEAAKHGNNAIMTPVSHCYFDYYQGPPSKEPKAAGGFTPISKVYGFDPIVEGLSIEEEKHVLGGQANVWSEFIPTEEHSQYMIFPRLTAFSETVWSTKASRDWDDFSQRLKTMLTRFEFLGINYAKSSFIITSKVKSDIESKSVALILHNEFTDSNIKYAIDNEELNSNSKSFTTPIVLNKTTVVKAALFENNKPKGDFFRDTIKFHKGVSSKVDYITNYHERYQGSGEFSLVNTLRGTENFRDGRWQAWLNKGAHVVIDLGQEKTINQVLVGSMENQKNSIYYPTQLTVLVSKDGEMFSEVQKLERLSQVNNESELKEFVINFDEQKVRYLKLEADFFNKENNFKEVWIFIDEILIN